MRIGILGGTFDPVHNGHIYLARKVCRRLKLSKVIFIPAYIPPHKKGLKVTPAKHRYNMLKLATLDTEKFKISDMEIKRKGRSYSVETLRRLKRKYGSRVELFFITGSDSLKELDKWKNLEGILKLCRFVVVQRPGFKHGMPRKGFIFLKIGAKDISATDIRVKIMSGKAISSLMPGAVKDYVYKHGLYRAAIALFFLALSNNFAYSNQDTASVITRSQEMIDKEDAIRERIDKNDKMFLKKAVITGITMADKEKIKKILQPLRNHWISRDDIQTIIGSISAIYREEGSSERIEGISYRINKNTLDITVKEKDN